MLVLAMLLTQQDSQASILHFVANAVESLGSCTTEGIFLDGRWQDIGLLRRRASGLPALTLAAEGGPVTLADVPWAWAYSLSSRHGPAGYLLAGGPVPPAGFPAGRGTGPARRGGTVPAAGAGPAGRGGAGERAPA